MVAKHVVEQEKGTKRENIRKAIAFLKETDGLLKIEDILPFFPDFALIDDFKVTPFDLIFFTYVWTKVLFSRRGMILENVC